MPRAHKPCAESNAIRLLTKSRHIFSRRGLYNLPVIAGEVWVYLKVVPCGLENVVLDFVRR